MKNETKTETNVPLGDYIKEFVQLCKRKESTGQLLGRLISEDQKQQGKQVFVWKQVNCRTPSN